jgi:D-amino-acid dehydrogenase
MSTPEAAAAGAPAGSDVLILGGGAIGLSCALLLLRAGRGVTVVDKGRVGSGSSHGNCGTITPSCLPLHAPGTIRKALGWMLRRDAPFYVRPRFDPQLFWWLVQFARRCNARDFRHHAVIKSRLLLLARERIAEFIRDERLACEFAPGGTLSVWRNGADFEAARHEARMLAELGVPVEVLDAAAVRAREPALRDDIVGGHWHPGDAQLRPDRYVSALADAVRGAGGVIAEACPVRGFQVEGGRIAGVALAGQVVGAREVVLALGAWSPGIARPLGLSLPIQPGKGYSITYTRPERAPRVALVLEERSVCVTTWEGAYRLGSTMEFSGYDARLDARRLAALQRGAAEYLELPEGPRVQEHWYGWRPMTYDDLPVIGRSRRIANLMLATGHGMLGVTLSAITGQLVAELLQGRTPSLDPAPFRPERFGA